MILRSLIIAILSIIVLFIGLYMIVGNPLGSTPSLTGISLIILSLIVVTTGTHYFDTIDTDNINGSNVPQELNLQ